jgi:protein-disulfide isomerase
MNLRPFLSTAALLALLLGAAATAAEAPAPTPPPDPPALSAEAQSPAPAPAPRPVRYFNQMGSADAPVLLLEFTDLQCPYCARHALQTFPQLKRDYIDTGKVQYASRDLPLERHRHAFPAAVASRCAGEQGEFWEFRHALFAQQDALASEPYARIAGELGLDVERLEACRKDGRQADNVRADIALAQLSNISATPSFVLGRIVNDEFQGETFSGAQPYENFKAKIDEQLKAAQAPAQ